MSNEVSSTELKAIMANQISIAQDSHAAFSEAVYIRAKILILQGMLASG